MSVRLFSNAEIHPLVRAALAAGRVHTEAEATRLGVQLLRALIEAQTWSYASIDASTYTRLRDRAETYRFTPGPPPDAAALTELIELYVYNAEADPGWANTPLHDLMRALRSR